MQKVPAQSILHAYATYDNTVNNPFQPNDPPKLVTQGEATTDEMMLVYFAYMAYQPGDENIVLDSTLLTTSASYLPGEPGVATIEVFPNPANEEVTFEYEITEATDIQTSISDLNGRTVKTFAEKRDLEPGIYRENTDLANLPAGLYFVRVQSSGGAAMSAKFVKN